MTETIARNFSELRAQLQLVGINFITMTMDKYHYNYHPVLQFQFFRLFRNDLLSIAIAIVMISGATAYVCARFVQKATKWEVGNYPFKFVQVLVGLWVGTCMVSVANYLTRCLGRWLESHQVPLKVRQIQMQRIVFQLDVLRG
eukprot:564405-Amphidinium_carterae.1